MKTATPSGTVEDVPEMSGVKTHVLTGRWQAALEQQRCDRLALSDAAPQRNADTDRPMVVTPRTEG